MTPVIHPNQYSLATAPSHTVFTETAMLARIGNDLRDLYGELDDASLPGDLLRLASLIDGKRQLTNEDRTAP